MVVLKDQNDCEVISIKIPAALGHQVKDFNGAERTRKAREANSKAPARPKAPGGRPRKTSKTKG